MPDDRRSVTPRFKTPRASKPPTLSRRTGRLRARSKKRTSADAVYRAFRARHLDGALCERCRQAPATEVHHRRTRAHGGHLTLPANALRSCGGCHRWIHAHPAEAHDAGWLVWPGDPDWLALAARPDRSTP